MTPRPPEARLHAIWPAASLQLLHVLRKAGDFVVAQFDVASFGPQPHAHTLGGTARFHNFISQENDGLCAALDVDGGAVGRAAVQNAVVLNPIAMAGKGFAIFKAKP